jgi:ankyrin repeat protein
VFNYINISGKWLAMDKTLQIKTLAKKNPTWVKVFLLWLDQDENLDISQLTSSFEILMSNKKLIDKEINVDYALSLLHHKDSTSRNIIEKFDDKMKEVLHVKKKEQFISSLKTEKYIHLFSSEVELEINTILDNKVSILALKHQFFNKLARYKTESDLLSSLSEFKSKNIVWNKAYFLNKIKEDNLNATIVDTANNKLMIEVRDYIACSALGSQAWCISYDRNYYNNYTHSLQRQMIYFDFDLPIKENESMIGFTIDMMGTVLNSHLKNDSITSQSILSEFSFKKMDEYYIKQYIDRSLSCPQKRFEFVCMHGLYNLYEEYSDNIDTSTLDSGFLSAIEYNQIEIIENMLKNPLVNVDIQNNHAIQFASASGYEEIVRMLLQNKNTNPSVNDNQALRYASERGHLGIVKLLLLDERVDPTAGDNYALRFASGEGYLEIVKILLKYKKVDPSAYSNHALFLASKNGHLEIVKILLKYKKVDLYHFDNHSLRWAAGNGYLEIVKVLLKDKRLHSSDVCDDPLVCAVIKGHVDVVRVLLQDKRVNPNAYCNKPIKIASEKGYLEIVKLLLKYKKVDPSASDNYAIRMACENGHLETAKILMTHKKVNPAADDNCAIKCASIAHLEVLEILIADERVDPSSGNNKAIRNACKNGKIDHVKILLKDPRVNPSVKNNKALILAVQGGYSLIVQLLLQDDRVDPSEDCNLALSIAIETGDIYIVKILLNHGRLKHLTQTLTPLQYAYKRHEDEIIDLLLKNKDILHLLNKIWIDRYIKENDRKRFYVTLDI